MTDTTKYQAHHNGPLTAEAAAFLSGIRDKHRWTYKYLGEQLGISGGFAHNIVKKCGNITSSKPMPRIAQGIAWLEAGNTALAKEDDAGSEDNLIPHTFHLRNNLQVTVSLPSDLTEREAERLGLFVRALAH